MTEKKGIRYISCGMGEFPDKLRGLSEYVEGIYVKGNADLLYKKSIAVVGSRRCSEYGKRVAMKIAAAAAASGLCVISGMAMGIDNYAHRGALYEKGDTLAVLGTGPDICYPQQHRKLYEAICDKGLLVSEYPPGTKAMPFRFPQRNRIIAGLAEAVVVVEARAGSGSLITAEYADSQNKPVFAVPGNITSQYSLGTNRLITEGAQAVAVVDDIFNYLGIQPIAPKDELEDLGQEEKRVYRFVKSRGEAFPDEICSELEMDPFIVNSVTSILEIKGFVSYSMGRIVAVKF